MMHSDQVRVDIDTVREMLFEQFPEYRHERVEPLTTTGTVNAIFRIGPSATARFPLRPVDPIDGISALRAEAAAMTEFAEHCPYPTPQPIGLGRPGPRYPMPWAVQTWIEGDVATPNGLSNSSTLALDLARLIESLRRVDTRGRRFDGQGRGGKLPDHDAWMATCLENSQGLLDVPRLRAIWTQLRELPPSGPDVMSHKDLTPANLLVHGEHLVGVLDGGGFGPADPALDLVAAWHLLDREQRENLRNHLGSSDIEWKRGAAWAFQQAMGLVWYYERSNPVMSDLGRSTLRRVVDETG